MIRRRQSSVVIVVVVREWDADQEAVDETISDLLSPLVPGTCTAAQKLRRDSGRRLGASPTVIFRENSGPERDNDGQDT